MDVFPSSRSAILNGPAQTPPKGGKAYEPVNCEFTDELEYVAVRRLKVAVTFWDAEGQLKQTSGLVSDIFTRDHEEFLVVGRDQIRLDRLNELRIMEPNEQLI